MTLDRDAALPLHGLTVRQLDDHLVTSFAAHTLRLLGARIVAAEGRRDQFEEGDALYRLLNPAARFDASSAADVAILGPVSSPSSAPGGIPCVQASVGRLNEGGRYADSELTLQALSGWAANTGDIGAERSPLRAPGNSITMLSGAMLAMLAIAGARLRAHGAPAPALTLDMRHVGVMAPNAALYSSYGPPPSRHAPRGLHPAHPFLCADGPFFLSTVEDPRWVALCDILGKPEWGTAYPTRESRAEAWPELQPMLAEALATWRRDDLFRACMARQVPSVPIFTIAEVAREPQLVERGASADFDGQAAPRLPWLARPKPSQAEGLAAAPSGELTAPLSDLLIIDMAQVWAGALCGQILSALGAHVIKLESRKNVDVYRRLGPFVEFGDIEGSGNWLQLNQGKVSMVLEPGDEADREALERFLDVTDVLVSNFRPGSSIAKRMADVAARRPGMVDVAISGFGEGGPWSENPLYGVGGSMVSGFAAATGRAGAPIQAIGFAYGDPTTGIMGALAAVAAIYARDRTGKADRYDVSMVESTLFSMTDLFVAATEDETPLRIGNRHAYLAPQGLYCAAGEDQWLAITVRSDAEWRSLCDVVGLEAAARAWTREERHARADEIDAQITAWANMRSKDEAAVQLRMAGIAAAPMLELDEVARDPLLLDTGMIYRMSHPAVGTRDASGVPWTIDGARAVLRTAPLLGADTVTATAMRDRAARRKS